MIIGSFVLNMYFCHLGNELIDLDLKDIYDYGNLLMLGINISRSTIKEKDLRILFDFLRPVSLLSRSYSIPHKRLWP